MTKDIYKITNLINNKIYIGQSVNTKHRWEQHVSASKHNPKMIIDKAIKKYGEENFLVELIEKTEQYDEREQYWISYYDSTNHDIGYNVCVGGRSVGLGVQNPNSKIKDQSVLYKIIDDIRNSKMNFNNIAELYGITPISVSEINNGTYYRQEDLEYPLRETKYTTEFYKRLIYSIQHELDKSLTDIAKEYEVDLSYVVEINSGAERWRSYLKYPLRESYCHRVGFKEFDNIVDALLNTDMQQKEIAQKFNVSFSVVSAINVGKTYKKDNISYPIRKNQQSTKTKRTLSPNEVNIIINDLLHTNKSCVQISQEIACHPNTVQGINSGKIIKYRNNKYTYPLRKM